MDRGPLLPGVATTRSGLEKPEELPDKNQGKREGLKYGPRKNVHSMPYLLMCSYDVLVKSERDSFYPQGPCKTVANCCLQVTV